MYGPDYTQGESGPKIDPQLKTFDTASALWLVVVGAVGFLILVRKGLRPPGIPA